MGEIMIVLDGMEDITYPELGGQTPFSHACCFHMSRFRQTGQVMRAVEGFETDSQTCMLRLLGVEKECIPTGRAYLEALSQNIPVEADDLLLRLNGVEVDDQLRIIGSCPIGLFDFSELNFPVYELSGYRGILRIPGGRSDWEGLRAFAPYKHVGQNVECVFPYGNALADTLACFSRTILQDRMYYSVIPWSPSLPCRIPRPVGYERAAFVCFADIVRGIAKALDIDCFTPATATGDVDTDLEEKCTVCLSLLDTYDFVLLHINGTDEASHRRNPVEKSSFLSKIDRLVIGPIMERVPEGTKVTVTSDHATLCADGSHNPMPVREWIWEKMEISWKGEEKWQNRS